VLKVNIEIEELIKAQHRNKAKGDRLHYLDNKINKLSIKERAYKERTEEELNDIIRLEQLGLRSLFKKVIGNIEIELEKERKEYLEAFLKHKALEEEIDELGYERELLRKSYIDPLKIEADLVALIKKKEFLLKSSNTKFTKELFKFESEIGRYKLLDQKMGRSIGQGKAALKILAEIERELQEVKDWSLMGKGNYASMQKKKYIDKARAKAIQATVRLEEFGGGLQMLFREKQLAFDMAPFVNFLDHFYENLITDFIVKKKLAETFHDLDKAQDKVETNIEFLVKEQDKYLSLISEKEHALRAFILAYENKSST